MEGIASAGGPWSCAPWSSAGVPAPSLPPGIADSGLPLAIRLIGAAATDVRLLTVGAWGEAVLGFAAIPRG